MDFVCAARSCLICESLGLLAKLLEVVKILMLERFRFLPAMMIGSWACLARGLILAGVEANRGLEAKVVRPSTVSTRGLVVSAQA